MQPLKPYFLGLEQPPHDRLADCQKVFRTNDLDNVGNTTRHLTFFEMLGNFSLGDYFKQGAVELRLGALARGLRLRPRAASGSRSSRATTSSASAPTRRRSRPGRRSACPPSASCCARARRTSGRSGPTGPCGPCSELYYDRGLEWGTADDLPGGENERFLEYWNLVFMQFNQDPVGHAHAAAQPEHRHRPGPQPDGDHQAGRRLGLRDRPVRAARRARPRAGRRASPTTARCGSSPTTRAR